jgi:uncharacterized protein YcnI
MLPGLLLAAPVLVLACALLLGRYPGERVLEELRTRPRRTRRRAARAWTPAARRAIVRILPRGGPLVAGALAGRGPPTGPLPARRAPGPSPVTAPASRPVHLFFLPWRHTTMTRKLPLLSGALIALALPAAPAAAHVTLQPKTATPGEYTVENVRVPNETDNADTVRIDLQLPAGFASVSYQPVPGWRVKVTKAKLATPVKTDDGEITEGVTQVSWIGDGKEGRIVPGSFQDFPLSVRVPGQVGDTLTFKAVQKYDNGDTVRWIGAPGSDEPAPTVKLVAAAADAGAGADAQGGPATTVSASSAGAGTVPATDGDADGDGLAIVALLVGGLGVLLGAGGLAVGRRRATA